MIFERDFIDSVCIAAHSEGMTFEVGYSPSGKSFIELCYHNGEYYEIREGLVIEGDKYLVYQENNKTNILESNLNVFYFDLIKVEDVSKLRGE